MQPTPLILPSRGMLVVSGACLEPSTSIFDERYIDGLRDRDPEVEAHFVTYFQRPIRAKARQQLWMPDLSEDACQETLLRVLHYFREGQRLDNPAHLPGFVLSFCHKIIQEMNRLKYRYQYLPDDWDLPGLEPDPYAVMRKKEIQQLVWKVLKKLRQRDQELLRAVLQDEDREEMCRQFGVTPDYLRVLLNRARAAFRKELEKLNDQHEPRDPSPPEPRKPRRRPQLGGVERAKGEGAD